jgi:hypothetical protein
MEKAVGASFGSAESVFRPRVQLWHWILYIPCTFPISCQLLRSGLRISQLVQQIAQ